MPEQFWDVPVTETRHGSVMVVAKDLDEATEKAQEALMDGAVTWVRADDQAVGVPEPRGPVGRT